MPDLSNSIEQTASNQLIIATAGHVDHGKTSLIKHLTGTNTDTLAEEQQRGLTINPGFAYHHFHSPKSPGETHTLSFVDVPGHADFIHNMLAGVGIVEQALLVVAADDGVMPQTREHLAILALLGIQHITVAVTKIDRVDSARIEQVCAEVQQLLTDRKLHSELPFCINNNTGEGVDTLLNHLKNIHQNHNQAEEKKTEQQARFLIDRCFTVKGIGTVVTGTLRSGHLDLTSQLVESSTGEEVRVRGIRLDNQSLEEIRAGQRAAINISAAGDNMKRGDWLLTRECFNPTYRFDAKLSLMEDTLAPQSNTEYHLYLGASHHVVTLRPLHEASTLFQIRCNESMHAHYGDRFVLRDPSARTTIGGGRVVDIFVPRKGRSSPQRIEILKAKCNPATAALPLLLELSPSGIDSQEYAVNYNLTSHALEMLISSMGEKCILIEVAGNSVVRLIGVAHYEKFKKEITDKLQHYHQTNSHQQGLSEPMLSKMIEFESSHLIFSGILNRLIAGGEVNRSGTILHLPNHKATLSKEEEEFLAKIHPILKKAGKIPPRTRELVDQTGIHLKPLERILRTCTQSGLLVKVAENRHYLPETIAELAEFTEQLFNTIGSEQGFTVIQFRDASGIGRNLCIELLEYFDSKGFTSRNENTRFVRTPKENIFG